MSKKAKKGKNAHRGILLRWLLALAAAAVLMTGLAVVLKSCSPKTADQPAQPTIAPNPYGPADFGYENGYLTCLSGESIPGIDVSYYQGDIDWAQVRAAGMEFAIIRVGYRGFDSGEIHADEKALENLTEAQAAGLKIGAYFFSQALSVEEAVEEAQFTLEMLEGYELELPVVFDWEYVSVDARTGSMDGETLNACARAFCDTVAAAGYQPMVYFNQDLAATRLDLSQFADLPWWLAMYSGEMTFPYRISFWQYTDQGQVPGIEGDVDLDLYFP